MRSKLSQLTDDQKVQMALDTYRLWGIRCASVEEFVAWYLGATVYQHWKADKSDFCKEAATEEDWCADRMAIGACCRADPMPELRRSRGEVVLQPHALEAAHALLGVLRLRDELGSSPGSLAN